MTTIQKACAKLESFMHDLCELKDSSQSKLHPGELETMMEYTAQMQARLLYSMDPTDETEEQDFLTKDLDVFSDEIGVDPFPDFVLDDMEDIMDQPIG